MSTKYRADLNATTMLGQAKTIIQVKLFGKSRSFKNRDKIMIRTSLSGKKQKSRLFKSFSKIMIKLKLYIR